MDYLDVVVHIFTPETREFYRLEQLWGEAPHGWRSATRVSRRSCRPLPAPVRAASVSSNP